MNTTFPRLLQDHAQSRPGDTALREKEYGIWQSISWSALFTQVNHMAHGFHLAGLARGDHVVGVGANRPRFYPPLAVLYTHLTPPNKKKV